MATELTGCVKWFNNAMNYGFITITSPGEYHNTDVFVHQSNIKTKQDCYRTLYTNECVQFTIAKTDNEKHPYQAVGVSGYNNIPLHCENPNYRINGGGNRNSNINRLRQMGNGNRENSGNGGHGGNGSFRGRFRIGRGGFRSGRGGARNTEITRNEQVQTPDNTSNEVAPVIDNVASANVVEDVTNVLSSTVISDTPNSNIDTVVTEPASVPASAPTTASGNTSNDRKRGRGRGRGRTST
jgi:cold shock CspA family protein